MKKIKVVYMECTLNLMYKSGLVAEVQQLLSVGMVKTLGEGKNYLLFNVELEN